MLYLGDLLFIFIFIFIMINRIFSWIQTQLVFYLFIDYVLLFLNNVDAECE